MGEYDLQPGESFVCREGGVQHGDGFLANYTDDLILTSQNLVLIKKGAFGNRKGVLVFPLNQIKVYQGHAQAVVGKLRGGGSSLDVYLQNGTEQFAFGNKNKAVFWSQKIDEVITGTVAKMSSANPSGAEKLTGAVKDTVGAVKDVFGLRSKAEVAAAAAAAPVAGTCVSCGAPVSGIRGQAVTCSYCDTPNQL